MRARLAFSALLVLASLAGCFGGNQETTSTTTTTQPPAPSPAIRLEWGAPVDLNAIGYEPSLACDSKDAMFVTAHKDLNRPDTWPYLASWILVSTDHGATWHAPDAPGMVYQAFAGDEGDVAVDARDWLYYVDTYLIDDHLHVWSQQGTNWEYTVPLRSTQSDDRPWVFAQGDGVVHYLGNNGVSIPGERYIYYRSADGGLTWTPGTGLPYAGWAHGAAQTNGTYTFISQEVASAGGTDIAVLTSSDSGATFGDPVVAGHRKGSGGDSFPLIASDAAGNPSLVWVDDGVSKGTHIFLSQSFDHGRTWNTTDVTPFEGWLDHVTVAGAGNGTVAVAFYATNATSPKDTSEWHLWAGMARGKVAAAADLDFQMADPKVLYTGSDLHALHDFFEVCVDSQQGLDIAYMTNLPQQTPNSVDGDRHLWFVRGVPATGAAGGATAQSA